MMIRLTPVLRCPSDDTDTLLACLDEGNKIYDNTRIEWWACDDTRVMAKIYMGGDTNACDLVNWQWYIWVADMWSIQIPELEMELII